MTATRNPSVRWDPDALAALEHERDILLRELRELDEQHAAAEVDASHYAALRDELTARAAEVLELITRGRAVKPARRHRPWVAALAGAGMAVAAATAGLLLTSQLAPRVAPAPPRATTSDATARVARLATVVQDRPEDVPARLALARLLLQQDDLPAALEQFDAVVDLDPAHAEALAYGGWVAVLTGDTGGGLSRLDRAVESDAAYPDARALRGLALLRTGDDAGAAAELRQYLALAPTGPLADQVESVIGRLEAGP